MQRAAQAGEQVQPVLAHAGSSSLTFTLSKKASTGPRSRHPPMASANLLGLHIRRDGCLGVNERLGQRLLCRQ